MQVIPVRSQTLGHTSLYFEAVPAVPVLVSVRPTVAVAVESNMRLQHVCAQEVLARSKLDTYANVLLSTERGVLSGTMDQTNNSAVGFVETACA